MKKQKMTSPFGRYYLYLEEMDKEWKETKEFGSMLILSLVEEVGEMARAYLSATGRKPHNIAAQNDESYVKELGDILVAILRFARIKKIDLNKSIMYSLNKIKKRKFKPKI